MRAPGRTGSQQVNLYVVTAVVCVALGAVSAAMASLNVAIPDLVRSTHASSNPTRVDHRCLPAGVLGAAAPCRSPRRPLRTPQSPHRGAHCLRERVGGGDGRHFG